MLKRRLIAILTGITLLMAVAGVSGVVSDTLGLSQVAYACSGTSCGCNGGGGGGGC